MNTFKRTNTLQKAFLAVWGNMMMPPEEEEKLNKIFESMDTDRNGVLTENEVREAVKIGSLPDYFVGLLSEVDTNGDGQIDLTEFRTAAQNSAKAFNEKNIEKAFKMFDKDGDGSISKAELNKYF